jgi:hypothetical protein
LIAAERWIEWRLEKQLQILPLRVRMTAPLQDDSVSDGDASVCEVAAGGAREFSIPDK